MQHESIKGWKPPIVYDVSIDEYRIAEQRDIDQLVAVQQAYGELRQKLKEMESIHNALLERMKDYDSDS